MKGLAALLLASWLLTGCVPRGNVPPSRNGGTTPSAHQQKPKAVEQLERELDEARKAEAEAKAARKAKEEELESARQEELRRKLHWVVGIALFAALGCLAGAIWLPLFKKQFILGILAALAVAALAMFVAKLLPWLPIIGAVMLGLATLVALFYWRFDNKALRQVVQAVEASKEKLPDYKERFSRFIDTDADEWIDYTRRKLGLMKEA